MSASLKEALERHMADDSLIKGWEVARRTCNGRERGPLRKAAREVNSIRSSVLEGKASGATNHKYVEIVGTLYRELAKAGEQDFDGMLGEALGWLEAQNKGELEQRLPIPAELTADQSAALERIRDYRFTNSPGHIGRAIDRNLTVATEIAKEVRAGLAALKAASCQEELSAATNLYVDAADRFCAELARAGEPDFDGLLRQSVIVLDSAPGVKATSKQSKGGQSGKGSNETGKGSKRGKGSRNGTKGDGTSGGGHAYGENFPRNYNSKGYQSRSWETTSKRTWYSNSSYWPDETSWGA